jgi:SAM-dependent methyltransferase/uncharacterized protein YbaR (Trm112 family)
VLLQLLDLLACPGCLPHGRPLALAPGHEVRSHPLLGDDVITGSLRCSECGAAYVIEDGVAVLLPPDTSVPPAQGKYDTDTVLGSYLWSSFGDIMGEEGAGEAYARWAAMVPDGTGPALDAGCAVGRSTLELAALRGFAVGLDLSPGFVGAARALLHEASLDCRLKEQGEITRQFTVALPERLRKVSAEFIVADAMAMPFKRAAFACAASLNVVDKLPDPARHLDELDRVLAETGADLLLSDPFSWSGDIAPPGRWLGGTGSGPMAGRSEDVLARLLRGQGGFVRQGFQVRGPEPVAWVIRNHANHKELITSMTFTARR